MCAVSHLTPSTFCEGLNPTVVSKHRLKSSAQQGSQICTFNVKRKFGLCIFGTWASVIQFRFGTIYVIPGYNFVWRRHARKHHETLARASLYFVKHWFLYARARSRIFAKHRFFVTWASCCFGQFANFEQLFFQHQQTPNCCRCMLVCERRKTIWINGTRTFVRITACLHAPRSKNMETTRRE